MLNIIRYSRACVIICGNAAQGCAVSSRGDVQIFELRPHNSVAAASGRPCSCSNAAYVRINNNLSLHAGGPAIIRGCYSIAVFCLCANRQINRNSFAVRRQIDWIVETRNVLATGGAWETAERDPFADGDLVPPIYTAVRYYRVIIYRVHNGKTLGKNSEPAEKFFRGRKIFLKIY